MRISIDTNVLVRAAVHDDPKQTTVANELFRSATMIAVSLPVLCEFVWVVGRVYKFSAKEIHLAIETLLNIKGLVTDRPAVDAGLRVLSAGGDFADGVIAFEGQRLGADVFVSFDKKATSLLRNEGFEAILAK